MEKSSPAEQVKAHLSKLRDQTTSKDEVAVIARMLEKRADLDRVYDELLYKHHHWQLVLSAIIEVAAEWSPVKIKSVRNAINTVNGVGDIVGINKEIEKTAVRLAELLRKRETNCRQSNLFSPHLNDPVSLMSLAAKIAGPNKEQRFATHVAPQLKKLYREQRYKKEEGYWPRIDEMLDALVQMQSGKATPIDDRCALALSIRQVSVRNFWRVLDVAILQCYVSDLDQLPFFEKKARDIADVLGLPDEMKPWLWLSHKSLATITECALGKSNGATRDNVQRYRSSEEKRGQHNG